jgi:fructose-specific phosphotransferase system IIC component
MFLPIGLFSLAEGTVRLVSQDSLPLIPAVAVLSAVAATTIAVAILLRPRRRS